MAQTPQTTIGHDIVHLPDLRAQLADPASTFVAGTFTVAELRASELRAVARRAPGQDLDLAPHLGARFAAKEAFLKALDLRFWGMPPPLTPGSIDPRDIEIVTDAWGRPTIALHGRVAETARTFGPLRAEVSLSHDGPFASAVVLLHEAKP
jgi:holo-[acyl-carrier protein] synthase